MYMRDDLGSWLVHRLQHQVASILLTVAVGLIPSLASPQTDSTPDEMSESCILCADDLPVPIVALSVSRLDSLGKAHSRFNAMQFARLDSLMLEGHFGPPAEEETRQTAHLLARITTLNSYRDLLRFACDSTRIYEADMSTLQGPFARYTDFSLFSAAQLERVRLGLGRVCIRYSVTEKTDGEVMHGCKQVRWRVKDEEIEDRKRPLLQLELPSGSHGMIKVFLAPHHSFAVEYVLVDGPPSPYEWFIVHDIEGAWLRKWGTHKPTAYMFWVTPVSALWEAGSPSIDTTSTPTLVSLPEDPEVNLSDSLLLGVRVYIPGLRLRLPFFLPDINLSDLREVELPMPILSMTYIQQNRQPSWIPLAEGVGFEDWGGFGPLPPAIRARFPDN